MKFYLIILLILNFANYSKAENQTNAFFVSGNYYHPADDSNSIHSIDPEESLLEDLESDEDNSAAMDFLENLRKNPYDLNSVTYDELCNIPFLNSLLAKNIIVYRNKIKVFESKRNLLKADGMTEELYEKMKIYVTVKNFSKNKLKEKYYNENISNKSKAGIINSLDFTTLFKSRFFQELQMKTGYLNGKYEGTRPKIYNQINSVLSKNNFRIEMNLTTEKDPGEKNLTDFVSGFIQLNSSGFLNTLVAGDYSINFAQGLAIGSSAFFSKGIDPVTPLKKKGKFVDGYSSVNETQFFRGITAKLNYHNLNLNLFYSDNFFDASLDPEEEEVSGFYSDGYHRTTSEIRRNNSVKEKLFGGRISYGQNNFSAGATYWKSKFSKPVSADSLKKLYNFSGNNASMIGADYDFIYKNINVFGEFARSQSKSVAGINALQITFPPFAELLFSYRNYPEDFAPLHSNGFGERSGNTNNERGFYAGISLKPLKGLYLNGYYDQFEFPYRTYGDPVSTSGNDFLTYIEWRAGNGLIFYLKYKNENKEETQNTFDEFGRNVKRIGNRNQTNARFGFIYQLTKSFRFRSRFEYVYIDYKNFSPDYKGTLFYSDIRFIPLNKLTFDLRYIIFDTDNYDSRIYEFENDIAGVMSNLGLYGKGRRGYVVMNYKPFPFFMISAKYAETYLDGVKSSGSGNDLINNDINNRLSLGMEILF